MAEQPNRIDYAERNKNKVERMLERDPGSVKAVIANTVETRRVAGKLQLIDIIFNNARQNLGYKISFEDFKKLFDMFQIADQAFEEIIEEATKLGIFTPREPRENKKSELKEHRETIEKMLEDKKLLLTLQKKFQLMKKK